MGAQEVIAGDDPLIRDLTRTALRAYMRAHKIGVPSLRGRIEGSDPRHREIPLSTLQRFIAGTHETSDHHVMLCYEFAKDLPYFGQDAALMQFGQGIIAYFAITPPPRERAPGGPLAEEDMAGDFSLFTLEPGAPPLMPGQDSPAAGRARVRRALAQDYFVVEETVFAAVGPEQHARRLAADGIAVLRDRQVHVWLRSALTGAPRSYSLSKYEHPDFGAQESVFTGEIFDAVPAGAAPSHVRIQLTRASLPEPVL